jgi:hypothetical protein
VRRLAATLSARDVLMLRDLDCVRCLTGRQLERLHLTGLQAVHRDRARRRVMARLIRLGVVTTFFRRVGGIRAGSAGLVYTLDSAGRRLLRFLDGIDDGPGRRPWETSPRFLDHTLTVAELYVQLRETERSGELELLRFLAEPASWRSTTTVGTLKPDAYVLLASGGFEYAWWCEIDMGTESGPTLRRKLNHYLLAVQAGVVGPDQFLPRVLICVPDDKRLVQVEEIIQALPAPANKLFHVTSAVRLMAHLLAVSC